jgi:DNA repair protein RadC
MTSTAGRDGKVGHLRRERRAQLHEAGGSALAAVQPQPAPDAAAPEGGEGETPHYHGHRERLRSRFREAGPGALADYELLELILFRAIPRRDVKPLAKTLIARFGSFGEVIAADSGRLAEIEGVSGVISEFKIVEAAAQRFAKGAVKKRLPLGSWSEVIDYCARRWRSRAVRAFGSCFSTRRTA